MPACRLAAPRSPAGTRRCRSRRWCRPWGRPCPPCQCPRERGGSCAPAAGPPASRAGTRGRMPAHSSSVAAARAAGQHELGAHAGRTRPHSIRVSATPATESRAWIVACDLADRSGEHPVAQPLPAAHLAVSCCSMLAHLLLLLLRHLRLQVAAAGGARLGILALRHGSGRQV